MWCSCLLIGDKMKIHICRTLLQQLLPVADSSVFKVIVSCFLQKGIFMRLFTVDEQRILKSKLNFVQNLQYFITKFFELI
ncbi:hypothetical protein OSTOST_00118 [Ostertagia ostertagi]